LPTTQTTRSRLAKDKSVVDPQTAPIRRSTIPLALEAVSFLALSRSKTRLDMSNHTIGITQGFAEVSN
jgi:hypothetical protein